MRVRRTCRRARRTPRYALPDGKPAEPAFQPVWPRLENRGELWTRGQRFLLPYVVGGGDRGRPTDRRSLPCVEIREGKERGAARRESGERGGRMPAEGVPRPYVEAGVRPPRLAWLDVSPRLLTGKGRGGGRPLDSPPSPRSAGGGRWNDPSCRRSRSPLPG